MGSVPDAIVPGLRMVEGGQTSTGSIVNWFKNQLCGTVKMQAEKEGCSVYDILNREAAKLPIGAEGLVALDFFQGNRTPHVRSGCQRYVLRIVFGTYTGAYVSCDY